MLSLVRSIVLTLGFTAVFAGAAGAQTALDPQLGAALRAGGHVIVLRHGATFSTQADTEPLNPRNIKKQRQLNPQGEAAAKALGAALKEMKVPIGPVVTSQFNRAYRTALLAGLPAPKKSIDVTEGGLVVPPDENNRRAAALRKLASTMPTAATNTVVVSHKPNIIDAFGKDWFEVKEGEASIFKPDGTGYKLIARMQMGDWQKLAAAGKQ
jgi:phosphohistidine phosphatase SixA